ncbi:helix-turn-helix domain-containing protein [Rhodococcus opacus]|uniref:helix-turn-helix domain-containing protein n=1 Tax=Rhodococcus opacus TaxID=37919 RepID=UPI001F5475C8|nr:helix-turn-helix domain-containing protein [Rhodococcus opacus]
MSPFALSRAFSAVMGVSLTLAGLAADLGFSDQAHMTRTMRAHLGETPTALRTLLSA